MGLDVTVAFGHSLDPANTSAVLIPAAVSAAKAADIAVVFLGLCADNCATRVENEGDDRFFLTRPGAQEQLLEAVYAANPRVVLVLIVHGGAIAIEWASRNRPAILDAHYPGELGGVAVVNTLLGLNNPGGKLAQTVF